MFLTFLTGVVIQTQSTQHSKLFTKLRDYDIAKLKDFNLNYIMIQSSYKNILLKSFSEINIDNLYKLEKNYKKKILNLIDDPNFLNLSEDDKNSLLQFLSPGLKYAELSFSIISYKRGVHIT